MKPAKKVTYSKIFNNSCEFVFEVDLINFRIIAHGKSLKNLIGYSENELAQWDNKRKFILIHPDDRRRFEDYWHSIIADVQDKTQTCRLRVKNKEEKWVSLKFKIKVIERNSLNKPVRIICEFNETEDSKKNILSKEILNNTLNGFIVFSPVEDEMGKIIDFQYKMVNPKAEELIGLSEEELVKKTLLQVFPGVKTEGLFDKYVSVFQDRSVLDEEHLYDHEHLKKQWFHSHISSFENYLLLSYENITVRKNAELELLNSYQKIERQQKLLEIKNTTLEVALTNRNKELARKEEEYRTLIMATNDIVWEYDPNDPDQKNVIYDPDSKKIVSGHNWLNVVHPDDQSFAKEKWNDAVSGKKLYSITYRINITGKYRYYLNKAIPLMNDEGSIRRWIGTLTDIHDKILAEKALKESERKYRTLAETVPFGGWMCNANGELEYISQSFLELVNVDEKEVKKLGWTKFVHPRERKAILNDWKHMVETGNDWEKEMQLISHDGTYRTVLTKGKALKNEKGKVTGWVGINLDISDRKRMEIKLQEAEKKYRIAFDSFGTGNAIYNAEGYLIMQNKLAALQLGGSPDDFIGKHYKEFVEGGIKENMNECFHKVLNTKQSVTVERSYNDTSGEKWFLTQYQPLYTDKNLFGIQVISQDITKLKNTEKELLSAHNELQKKHFELSKFHEILENILYISAHDLKSPISNIKVIFQLMDETHHIEQKLSYLSLIRTSVNRLENTLSGLNEIIKLKSEKSIVGREVSFHEVMKDIHHEVYKKLEAANGTLITGFEVTSIKYLKPFLTSIIRNLVVNAIKYAHNKRNPLIEITTKKRNEYILLMVKDNGIGMDLTEVGHQLFQPFKRFTSKSEGSGVGLYIIKNIIEKNGGYISVESKPNEGTTFYCYLKEYIHEIVTQDD